MRLIVLLISFLFHLNTWASKPEVKPFKDFWESVQIEKRHVRSGQTLSVLLREAHFNDAEVTEALRADILPGNYQMRVDDTYLIFKNKDVSGVYLFGHYFRYAYFFMKDGHSVQTRATPADFSRKLVQVSGKVVGSLIESIRQLTGDETLAYRFLDAYTLSGNPVRLLKRGDRFEMTYEQLYLGGTFIRNGEVLNTSLEINGETRRRKFVNFPDGGVFISKDKAQAAKPFYAPVSYLKISSLYNPRRLHPIKKRRQPHLGIDFELPPDMPVFASKSGTVVKTSRSRAGGYFVQVRHEGGYESFYNHLNSISPKLAAGAKISAGTELGKVGCTGYCTKPHLHFGIKKNGKFVDPAKYIRSYPAQYEKNLSNKGLISLATEPAGSKR